jgi:hypothetical protein
MNPAAVAQVAQVEGVGSPRGQGPPPAAMGFVGRKPVPGQAL